MKIYALCDIDTLRVSDVYKINFENCVNYVYKQSEVGAKGVVLVGKQRSFLLDLFQYLADKLDVPLFIYAKGAFLPENPSLKSNDTFTSFKQFETNKDIDIFLIKNKDILRHFSSEKSYLPELISVITAAAFKKGVRILITEETQSAVKALSVIKKLF